MDGAGGWRCAVTRSSGKRRNGGGACRARLRETTARRGAGPRGIGTRGFCGESGARGPRVRSSATSTAQASDHPRNARVDSTILQSYQALAGPFCRQNKKAFVRPPSPPPSASNARGAASKAFFERALRGARGDPDRAMETSLRAERRRTYPVTRIAMCGTQAKVLRGGAARRPGPARSARGAPEAARSGAGQSSARAPLSERAPPTMAAMEVTWLCRPPWLSPGDAMTVPIGGIWLPSPSPPRSGFVQQEGFRPPALASASKPSRGAARKRSLNEPARGRFQERLTDPRNRFTSCREPPARYDLWVTPGLARPRQRRRP